MSKKLLLLTLLTLLVSAFDSSYWWITKEYKLDKDRPLSVVLKRDKDERKLYFLWTLFMDKELVCKLWYQDAYKTFSLSKQYKRDIYRVKLYDSEIGEREDSYALIRFVSYDKKTLKANISLYIHNELESIEIKENDN